MLNVVTGPDANMSALIRNPDVAKVCFTGSVNGGKKMMELASQSLTRVTLELGGNDAAIVLKDAIIDDVHLDRLFAAIYDTTGQICMNAKRLFVHQSRVDEVVKGLSARLEKVKLGYGLDKDTTMGPLHSPAQKAFVDGLIKEAKDSGAKVLEFGELPGGDMKGGNFVRPAIVVNPDLKLRVVTEEQFGPVIPMIPFDTEEEAVRMANDSWAGLSGSVWTADPKTANRVGGQLVCGYVWVNDHGATRLDLRAPFGGMKSSGIGREQASRASGPSRTPAPSPISTQRRWPPWRTSDSASFWPCRTRRSIPADSHAPSTRCVGFARWSTASAQVLGSCTGTAAAPGTALHGRGRFRIATRFCCPITRVLASPRMIRPSVQSMIMCLTMKRCSTSCS